MNPKLGASERIVIFPRPATLKDRLIGPTLLDILYEILEIFEEKRWDVFGTGRAGNLVTCRRIFCYVALEITNKTCARVGKFIGLRDHSGAIHHRDLVRDFLEVKDHRFMEDWKRYVANSKIYQQYLNSQ